MSLKKNFIRCITAYLILVNIFTGPLTGISLGLLPHGIPSVSATSSVFGTTGNSPFGITIDSAGNIYTTNNGDDTVTKITPAGVSSVFGTTGDMPIGVTIDSAGNIYTANSGDNTVTKITPAGVSSVFGTTGVDPRGIAIDSSGNIYTTNYNSNSVTKITPAGVSSVFGTTGNTPFGVTIDSAGNIYTTNVRDNTVTKITPAGVSSVFGTTGSSPFGITIDSTGNIYTANYSDNTITKITPAGVSSVFGTTGNSPFGITIDSAGNIYTTNSGDNTVAKFTPAGVSSVFGTTGNMPFGITIDSAGNIYGANNGDNTVTKITPPDNTPPVVTLSGSSSIIVQQFSTYTDSGASWTDTVDGSGNTLDATFTLSGTVNTAILGIYTLTYTKVDTSGNSTSTTRTVEVQGLWTTGVNPRGITIDPTGNIYTANYGNSTVTKITPAGVSSVFGTTGDMPFGVTIDSTGNIYTVNYNSNSVTKITPAGVSSVFGTTGGIPVSITLDSAGNIYTANYGNSTVTKITPAGVSSVFGTTGSIPVSITIDSTGNIYTANFGDNTITKITPAGVSSVFGTTGVNPRGITLDSAGNIYTVNSGDNTVTKITPAGVSSVFGTTGNTPFGVTIDSTGNIYTTNNGDNTVTKITPAGVSSVFGTTGNGPRGITLDSAGNIYTANLSDNTVTKITPPDNTPPVVTLSGSSSVIVPQGSAYTDAGASWTDTVDGSGNTLSGIYGATGSFQSSGSVNTAIAGVYSLQYKKVDAAGNTSNVVTRTITVIDQTAPVVTLSGSTNITIEALSGSVFYDSGATCSDNVGVISSIASVTGSVDMSATGTYSLQYSCTDTVGLIGTGTRTVHVRDTTPPILAISGSLSQTIQASLTVSYSDPGTFCTDNLAILSGGLPVFSGSASSIGTVVRSILGNYTLHYTCRDISGLTATGQRLVNVVDTTIPVVTLSGSNNITIEAQTGAIYKDSGATCSDNYLINQTGATLSGSVNMSATGTYTLQYSCTDVSGNRGTNNRTIHVVDTTAPVVTLSGSSSMTIYTSATYTELGATCTDNLAPLGSIAILSGSVNTAVNGTYTLLYTCRDATGNSNSLNRVITVTPAPSSGGGSGGGGGGVYIKDINNTRTSSGISSTGSSTSPKFSSGSTTSTKTPSKNPTESTAKNLLITQSLATPTGDIADSKNIYTIENRVTDFVCPKIVQEYSLNEVKAQDIPSVASNDSLKAMIMFRGLEEGEYPVGKQTIQTYKNQGIALNRDFFEPNNQITRAEYTKMLVRALSCRYTYIGKYSSFTDVDPNQWYAEYVTFAVKNGWINGYGDGTFHPNAPITRAEAAKILANAIRLPVNKTTDSSSFNDVPKNSTFKPYIEALKQNQIMNGVSSTVFAPDSSISRKDVSRVIYKTFLGGKR